MKKAILFLAAFSITIISFAQQKKELKHNETTNLIDATYFHDNGKISQEGTFDLAGKLHGEWTSFDDKGEKVSMGAYDKGIRTGKWFFWTDGNVKEVEFSNNAIASVVDTERRKAPMVIKD